MFLKDDYLKTQDINKNKLTDNNTVLSAYFFIIYPKSG